MRREELVSGLLKHNSEFNGEQRKVTRFVVIEIKAGTPEYGRIANR